MEDRKPRFMSLATEAKQGRMIIGDFKDLMQIDRYICNYGGFSDIDGNLLTVTRSVDQGLVKQFMDRL